MDTLGLYVSVPFCKAKCTFCNFASDAFPPERMAGYVDRLCAETAGARGFAAKHAMLLPPTVDSIFIGGGTPSLLEPAQMRRLFSTVREEFAVDADAEVTMEAAPGQIEGDLLDAMLAGGVNRVSLGVQSFVDAEARAVGRSHTGASCLAELERLCVAGVSNLSVDLIAGLPHQTPASWAESLQQAIGSGVGHVSVYMLEVDEDSRLGRELIGPGIRYGAHAAPGEAMVADLYSQACETLGRAGLQQYEISNFARAGYRSRHNCKYWTRAPYLGFGLDAHSMLHNVRCKAVRFNNGDDLDEYLSGGEPYGLEFIDQLAAWEETIFLGLRLTQGLSANALRSAHPAPWLDALLATAMELQTQGLMRVTGDRIALTHEGRLVSSSIFGELLAREPVAA